MVLFESITLFFQKLFLPFLMICVKNLKNDTSCKMYVCTLLSHSSNSEQQYEGGRQCNSKWMTDQKIQTKKLTFGQPTNLCTKAGHETTPQISTLH